MYSRILVPVDLAHKEKMVQSLDQTEVLAKAQNATVVFVGVTPTVPGQVAHSPEEFRQKLSEFADAQANERGFSAESHTIKSHDPAIDLADKLTDAIDETRSDLVVMATHLPGAADYIFQGNAAHVAAHAPCSVFVVRAQD